MNYELGSNLPPNVLIGGFSAVGLPVYIDIRDGAVKPGYYNQGSHRPVSVFALLLYVFEIFRFGLEVV